MTEQRTFLYSRWMIARHDDAVTLFEDALASVGIQTRRGTDHEAADLYLKLGSREVPVRLKRRAVVPVAYSSVSALGRPGEPDMLSVVVADRISAAAREALRELGWGWFDLRGSLHVAGDGLLIQTEVPAVWARPTLRDPLSAPAGLAVACAILTEAMAQPGEREEMSVRGLARRLDRAASTVSEALRGFREQGLVEGTRASDATSLFWRIAEVWPNERVNLAGAPREGQGPVNSALGLNLDPGGAPGWALTDTLAAGAYGAPVVTRADQPPDYFVPSGAVLARARTLFGVADSARERAATVRTAPVPEVCSRRVDASSWSVEHRPLAAPLYVALDLAQDLGRGREILDGWTPRDGWNRVW